MARCCGWSSTDLCIPLIAVFLCILFGMYGTFTSWVLAVCRPRAYLERTYYKRAIQRCGSIYAWWGFCILLFVFQPCFPYWGWFQCGFGRCGSLGACCLYDFCQHTMCSLGLDSTSFRFVFLLWLGFLWCCANLVIWFALYLIWTKAIVNFIRLQQNWFQIW